MIKEDDGPKPPPKSFFSLGWEFARTHPNHFSAAYAADHNASHLWYGRFSRKWWIDGFNAYRVVLEEQCEAKKQKGKKR